MTTIAELILSRAEEHGTRTALLFEEQAWTWAEYADACAERASMLLAMRRPGPFHIGALLDNVPEFPMWLSGLGLAGGTLVGVNSTRRGAELERDIRHADCAMIVTERSNLHLLEGLDLGIPEDRILVVDDPSYADVIAPYADAELPPADIDPSERLLIVFTSGSTGAPKGVICSQGRLAGAGVVLGEQFGFDRDSVNYICMPMFHGNALMANWSPALRAGGAVALRRKFSASGFLSDVRRYGATYFTYVGRAISYILATPEREDDADNTLRGAFGTEAGAVDMARFEKRFGCALTEGYGSSEGGMAVNWRPGTPERAVGPCPENAKVLNPETGEECAIAVFDDNGILLNPDEAIGELVNTGRNGFEGYWRNEDANAARTRDGLYWTGDHFYKDADGYLYFAARSDDKLRVDSENIAVAYVENILARHEGVEAVVVYAVPDPVSGDQVMATFQMRPGATFDPVAFREFLAAQEDLGTKMAPRFVRVTELIPTTATSKVNKVGLRREGFRTDDPVWWTPVRGDDYRLLDAEGRADLIAQYVAAGRESVLEI
jgi:fatty-acyl-CoA synthase